MGREGGPCNLFGEKVEKAFDRVDVGGGGGRGRAAAGTFGIGQSKVIKVLLARKILLSAGKIHFGHTFHAVFLLE